MSNKNLLITSGLALIALGFAPTPDDVTVVSPLLQITIGAGLVIWGMVSK